MLKRILILSILLPVAWMPGALSAELIVMAGQSNMEGVGLISELPESCRKPPGSVFIWDAKEGRFVPLKPMGWQPKHFGPEIGVGHALARACPDRTFHLVKYAVGGTDLQGPWKPGKGDLYRKCLARVREAAAELKKQKQVVRFRGFLWMQGESDAMNESHAALYEKTFRRLIREFRRDLGAPALPFVFGQITPKLTACRKKWKFPHTEVVRQAQAKVAASMKGVHMVRSEDLGLNWDNVHFNASGQLALGERLASGLLTEAGLRPAGGK
jgi:hypothetical protein